MHHAANRPGEQRVFFFFSNKLGIAGSIVVSIVLSLIVYGIVRLFW